MADLANTPGRRVAQRRITNNRDGVLPSRRNTDAPSVAIRADMRTATRGDGGARELGRILDDFVGAIPQAGRAKVANDMDRYRVEAARAIEDASLGLEPNEESVGSAAYREAFYRTRLESRFTQFAGEVDAEVDAALADGRGPGEVHHLVLERVARFRDENLDTLPDGVAVAPVEAAARLSTWVQGLETRVNTRIREATRQEFVDTEQGNIRARLLNDEPVSLESYVQTFRAGGLAPSDAKKAAVDAVLAVALDRDTPRPELLDHLLESTQADGKTPSLSASEQLTIQDRITQARSLADQVEREAREDRRDALIAGWYPRALDGDIMDDEIDAAVASGTLTPQEGVSLRGMTEGLRDAAADGHLNEDFLLDVQERLARGNTVSLSQVSSWFAQGRFGTGRDARRAAIQIMGSVSDASRARRGSSSGTTGLTGRQARAQEVTLARSYLMGALNPGAEPNNYQLSMRARAGIEFNRRVVAGESPMAVAESMVEPFQSRIMRGTPDRQSRRLPSGDATVTAGDYVWTP